MKPQIFLSLFFLIVSKTEARPDMERFIAEHLKLKKEREQLKDKVLPRLQKSGLNHILGKMRHVITDDPTYQTWLYFFILELEE